MARRSRRASQSAANHRVVQVVSETSGGPVVALALEARLFGRVRLLTIDAVLDAAPVPVAPAPHRAAVGRSSPAGLRSRRLEAEVLLRHAQQALADPGPPIAAPPVRREVASTIVAARPGS